MGWPAPPCAPAHRSPRSGGWCREVPVAAAASPRAVGADHCGTLLWVLPRTADDHQARVEPHAEGEDVSCRCAPRTGVAHALTQLKRRQHGPPSMILLSHRRAKDHRKAFTRRGYEGAIVTLDHLVGQSDHRLQHRVLPWAQLCDQARHIDHETAEGTDRLVFPVGARSGSIRHGER